MVTVQVVGGGLSGSETAWQLADRGIDVDLYEMRPSTETGAHRTENLAEIVCTNSFKSTLLENASGLLKAEMSILGCRLLEVAQLARVPAGHALAVDRDAFSESVTSALESHPRIQVARHRQDDLDIETPAVIATGPLTGEALSASLQEHCSSEHLYFYDAIAPSIDGATLDADAGFWASRYDKGEADYFNIPLDKDEYLDLIRRIQQADLVDAHAFEEAEYFESCLPVEVIVSRGEDTLRHGPLKPRGLTDPRTGREPYACIQLRQESREGTLMGLVGFQTRMKHPVQKEVLQSIRGLSGASILRYGSIHRNIFMNIPEICDRYLRDRRRDGLYYAGQICGVEGYVECIMSGIVVALSIYAASLGRELPPFPNETMIGSLMNYVHTPCKRFQPMNANMGILPIGELRRIRRKRERYTAVAERAIAAMNDYRARNAWLFENTAASSA